MKKKSKLRIKRNICVYYDALKIRYVMRIAKVMEGNINYVWVK